MNETQRLTLLACLTELRGKSLDEWLDALASAGDFDRIAVALLHADGRTLVMGPVRAKRDSALTTGMREAAEQSLLGRVLDAKKPQQADDRSLRRYPASLFFKLTLQDKLRAHLLLSLHTDTGTYGILWLSWEQKREFAAAELAFARLLAAQLANSLQRARWESKATIDAQRRARLSDENAQLRDMLTPPQELSALAGHSYLWRKTLRQAEMVATADSTVLILGETGTGKGMLARAIHDLSPRKNKPFVAVNCGALAQDLISSELFGHERGAFTGAHQRRLGRLDLAQNGTLFLDEVGELPLTAQTRLLRVLQESVIVRVGENKPRQVDCRIIAATHRNLEADVKSGRFRQDLFYRLKVVDISLPPLRKRVDDLPLLCEHLLEPFGQFRIHPDAMEILRKYRWPGNVRELKNVLERMAVLARPLGQPATGVITLTVDDIPMELRRAIEGGQRVTTVQPRKIAGLRSGDADADVFAITPDLMLSLEPLHVQYARWVVKQLGGNKTKAAKALGIQRATLYAWLERGSEEPEATDTRE